MRKKNSKSFSSFDLFLDAMCNTFGGIILIALLLALMPSNSPTYTTSESDADAMLAEADQLIEINRIKGETESIERRLAAQDATKTEDMSTDMKESLVGKAKVLKKDILDIKDKISQTSEDIAKELKIIDALQSEEKEANQQIAQLKKSIKEAEKFSPKRARLPKLQEIYGKRTVWLAIRNGKFFTVNDISVKDPVIRGYDSSDVRVESGPALDIVQLIPGAGQPIRVGQSPTGKLLVTLRNIDAQSEYIHFLVDPDSFAEFNYVKKLFVAEGFDYNWNISSGSAGLVPTDKVEHQ